MTIVTYLTFNCEPAAGTVLLRLLLIWWLRLSWVAYQQAYPQGWTKTSLLKVPRRLWRLRPRTPEACEACQKGVLHTFMGDNGDEGG